MRLATLYTGLGPRAVRVDGEVATQIGLFEDVGQILRQGPGGLEQAAAATGPTFPLATARFASPVANPAKIVCVGLNYRSHIEETGQPLPEYPTLFSKWASALVGHGEAIELPPESDRVDWEGEMVVVIGQAVRRARGERARQAIGGYSIMCDTSMRDWQNRTPQILQGKSWDRATPVGPVMITPDELAPGAVLTTTLNGEVVQQASTDDLVFDPVELVEYISTCVSLEPGDLIATGTPSGVGDARRPPRYLLSGDTIGVHIESIGQLSNPVCDERI